MKQEEKWLLEEKYKGEKSEAFFNDLKRLATGEPLGYVIGYVPFLDTKIYLDSHPLVPRPEKEHWVEQAILQIKNKKYGHPMSVLKVLDLCAGSGAIGVAVAGSAPNTYVTFAEIDRAHLPTIGKNLSENGIPCTRYMVVQSNLFDKVDEKYEFILCNPPYIDPKLDRTEASVKDHEPHLALYGGVDGLDIIKDIITQAPKHLAEGGQLWLEHEPEQSEQIQRLSKEYVFSATTHKDQYGIERYTVLIR